MSVLYLRNVPDEVVDALNRLADRESMSVSAFAARELGEIARRVDNAALLGDLPDLAVGADVIVGAVDAARAER